MPMTRARPLRLHRLDRCPDDPSDRGVVAVLVAILISGVLLVVGALTVDLGSVWAERAGLQSAAQSSALAAAALLPEDASGPFDNAAVVDAAVRVLCSDGNRRDQWGATAAGCESAALSGWATNADPADGAVSTGYSPASDYPDISDPDLLPRVVTVRTPPVRVDFGLAQAAGIDHTNVASSATARRGLPYPADSDMALRAGSLSARSPYSPYYLTVQDLRNNQNSTLRALCLRTVPRTSASSFPQPPAADPGYLFGDWAVDAGTGVVVDDTDGDGDPNLSDNNPRSFTMTGAQFGTTPPAVVDPAAVTVYVGMMDAAHAATTEAVDPDGPGTWRVTFRTPDLSSNRAFGPVPVWWVYDDGTRTWTSSVATLDYPAPTGSASGDCDTVPTGRGVVDAAALDPADSTRDAVAGGLATRLVPFGARPRGQVLPDRDVACDDPAVNGEAVPATVGDPAPDGANCVPLTSGGDVSTTADALTQAWLSTDPTRPGRLRSRCSGQVGSISGLGGGFDQTDLFTRSNGLVTSTVSTTGLRARIRSGLAADPTYARQVTPSVFDCPRLLLVPVIDATPPADASKRYAVVGFTYFWVSDVRTRDSRGRPLRGLMVTPSLQVVGIRGWVVDPGYVQGGDWVPRNGDPDVVLPMSVPRKAVLVATLCDHPDHQCP